MNAKIILLGESESCAEKIISRSASKCDAALLFLLSNDCREGGGISGANLRIPKFWYIYI